MSSVTGQSDMPAQAEGLNSENSPVNTVAHVQHDIARTAHESLVITGAEVPLPRLSRLPTSVPTEAANESGLAHVNHTNARLPVIDDASVQLWRALHAIRPRSNTYAADFASEQELDAPSAIQKTLNIEDLELPKDVEGKWYGVCFRSKRRPNSESINLYEADRKAHEEAVASGGLIFYWYGVPDKQTGFNMATCIWTDQESARRASALPDHHQATKHAMLAYTSFDLSRYEVAKVKGETGLRIKAWPKVAGSYH